MSDFRFPELIVIGGGLSGCEAAWQAAQQGINVSLYEMRPGISTGAHISPFLAELVCSNSLGSDRPDRAAGVLKRELRRLVSLLMTCADETRIPAGEALAVDREAFSKLVTSKIEAHPRIQVIREEVSKIPSMPTVIASGPLTSAKLTSSLVELTSRQQLYFYDAIAPIVSYDSINLNIAFRGSRHGSGYQPGGDYLNCPLTHQEYDNFVDALISAERIALKEFEHDIENGVQAGHDQFFEGCLPVEILARRGREALAYGPLRPVGLRDPRTGRRPYAVVQLRQDNLGGTLYNLVGFQTNLTFPEQQRVFRQIPGLESAVFERFGQMHRNTFIFSPALLEPTLQLKEHAHLFMAGQITGVEGYVGNIGTGWLAGWNAARYLKRKPLISLPVTTMLGALCHYVTHASAKDFQPMKANFGILPPLENIDEKDLRSRKMRSQFFADRALSELERFLNTIQEN